MPPPALQPWLVRAFWLLLVAVGAVMLRRVCAFFGEDFPSWRRALFMVVFVGGAAYLTFDFTAYVIMRSMDDVMLRVPPGYGYANWFGEPFAVKWYVISKIPLVRYLPFVFALCVGGMLQTILLQLQVPFRRAAVIFVAQWVATLLILGVVSFVVSWGLRLAYGPAEGGEAARPVKQQAPGAPPPGSPSGELEEKIEAATVTLRQFWDKLLQTLDPYLDEVKEAVEPLTRYLPTWARQFLDGGGWWLVLGGAAVIVLLWLRGILRSLARLFARPHRKKKKRRRVKHGLDLREDLTLLAQAATEEPPRRLTVKGVRARLRLVVLASATRDGEAPHEDAVDHLLDWIKPGLAAVCSYDYPRVRVWPAFYSEDGFDRAFLQNVAPPTAKGQKSGWAIVSGRVEVGQQKFHLGLALYTDEPTALGCIQVRGQRWLDVFAIEKEPAGAGV
jgi:hypothetical protein